MRWMPRSALHLTRSPLMTAPAGFAVPVIVYFENCSKTQISQKSKANFQFSARKNRFLWYNPLCANTYLGARVERTTAMNPKLEEFIRLLKLHPELHSALRQILVAQEPQHEMQPEQPQKV